MPKPAPIASAPIEDATLIEQAKGGDERAFATLYRRHARYVAGVAYRLLGNDDEVDDVVQMAFTDAASGLNGLREAEGFRSWLVKITVRRVHGRIAKRRRFRWLTGAVEEIVPQAASARDRHIIQDLYEVLHELPPTLRLPWILHHIEGETLPKVAEMCEVSLATVKRRIASADAQVKGRLHDA